MDKRPWHAFYDEGIPATFPFVERTLVEALERAAANRADAPALYFLNRRMTYRELKDQVDRLATALARLGVVKGTRVAIQLPNLPQTVIAYYAVLAAGGQVVMTNPLYVAREIEYQWFDANCEVAIVADFIFEQRIRPIRDQLPVKHYIVASIPEYLGFPLNLLAPLKLKRMKPPSYAQVRPEPARPPLQGAGGRARRRPAAGRGRDRRHRRPPVHRRHHRRRQGRGAHPPQPLGQRPERAGVAPHRRLRRRRDPLRAAVLPRLRDDDLHELPGVRGVRDGPPPQSARHPRRRAGGDEAPRHPVHGRAGDVRGDQQLSRASSGIDISSREVLLLRLRAAARGRPRRRSSG